MGLVEYGFIRDGGAEHDGKFELGELSNVGKGEAGACKWPEKGAVDPISQTLAHSQVVATTKRLRRRRPEGGKVLPTG